MKKVVHTNWYCGLQILPRQLVDQVNPLALIGVHASYILSIVATESMIRKQDIEGSESYSGTARVLHVLTLINKHRKRRSKVGNDNPLEGVGLYKGKAFYYCMHIHTLS